MTRGKAHSTEHAPNRSSKRRNPHRTDDTLTGDLFETCSRCKKTRHIVIVGKCGKKGEEEFANALREVMELTGGKKECICPACRAREADAPGQSPAEKKTSD